MSYNKEKVLLRPGLRFDGYGEDGEAIWSEIVCEEKLSDAHLGADDGLTSDGDSHLSVTDAVGTRGEAVYTLKTVYTDITVDCVKDAAYDYGLHFKGGFGSDPEYYRDRGTSIEVYMVRGQDGRVYVYGEITDPDIVVNDEIMAFKPHYCDGLHPYVDTDNYGQFSSKLGLIIPDDSGKHLHRAPKGCVVKMTDKGFRFEYAFDNQGKPFFNGDVFGFNFFYNDTNEYTDINNYKRTLVKLPSRLNPMGSEFMPISAEYDDAILISEESATGAFELSAEERPQKEGDLLRDIVSGAANTCIVCDSIASAHTVIAAKNICKRLRAYGAKTELCLDGIECGDTVITVGGNTNGDIEYNGYSLTFGENRIVLSGWLEEAVNTAQGLLMSAFDHAKSGGSTDDLCRRYSGAVEGVPLAPEMEGISTVTDAGDGAYLLLKLDADPEECHAYTKKLSENGYTLYTSNRMVSVDCYTYVRDDSVVNVTYGEVDRSLRAVVEPSDKTALPNLGREEYAPTCKTFISQLATKKMLWMCYVIKQDNGEYFIIDSGGNRAHDHLYASLMEMSGGEEVTVSCWLLTHFHQDHIGGLVSLVDNDEYMKKIRIKSVICNFPQKQVLDTAQGSGDRRNIEKWQSTLEKTGAKVYQARTGQKYYFGNVELQMIFTYEDLMPFNVYAVRTNPTSHIFTMRVEGQKFMMMGDACREATELCVTRYGDALRSDFVQLSHHGWGDGGTSEEFYHTVNAPWVLYPSATYSPKPAEELACKLAEKYFLDPDNNIILDLPYTSKERN